MRPKSQLPKRPRLHGFDYAGSGFYFVTLVTDHRACTLSSVVNFQIVLSKLGRVLEEQLLGVQQRFGYISVDAYVIMPNHVHILFWFEDADQPVTLSRIVNEVKSKTTVRYNNLTNSRGTVWQYGYHDVIIRSDKQLFSVRRYIQDNPIKWELDELNPASTGVVKARSSNGASACTTLSGTVTETLPKSHRKWHLEPILLFRIYEIRKALPGN